ncbi:MAG: THUMP domain-containing class I SAM-dependent RNA methyltransferase [Candidatus Merdivicinus sp.]|jgi:putative N6-adenine-specific DNA methylase
MNYQYIAPCHFGLERVLSGELKRLGASDVVASDGRVAFSGGFEILARANLNLRTAERVLICLGEFEARSFAELFDHVRELPFEEFIGRQDAFPVKGHSVHSQLHSIPDCQSIIKKAAVERLKEKYGVNWFEETGPVHQIQFNILKDRVTISLDTSGAGLHKRGYRKNGNDAPIKETLAAGILDVAGVRRDSIFYDPFCGSGTFLIEAALKALNIPSGINRKFAAQNWDSIPQKVWSEERSRGLDLVRRDAKFAGYGSDLDPKAVDLALFNANKAGVAPRVRIRIRDIRDFRTVTDCGIIVTNPPYGERLLDIEQARRIYREMGRAFARRDGFSYAVITPDEQFEQYFGRRATKRRKLYNGMLKCNLYQYSDPAFNKKESKA